jgi:hypothetical protein
MRTARGYLPGAPNFETSTHTRAQAHETPKKGHLRSVPCRAAVGGTGRRNLLGYERTRHQTKGGLMPLVDGLAIVEEPRWLAPLNGGSGLEPPKGPAGEGNPEGHGYTSAHIGPGQDSEST